MKPIRLLASFAALAAALVAAAAGSDAQESGKISLIRDAEIENTIRVFARPVLEAAGLDPRGLGVHLVLDDRLNAFVAGGQRIFINTGLLRNAEDANAVIGVLAHETGHIAGGHLAQMQENLRSASAQSVIALVLGAVVAGASGNADAAIAGATLGQSVAERSFLRYSRSMESQADQAALRYLDETGQSAAGLLDILHRLQGQELLTVGRQDPYIRTHPLSQERITAVRTHVETSSFSDKPVNDTLSYMHRRMRGKLNGYIDPASRTLARYDADDPDIEARYARIFAFEQLHETDKALALTDALIAENPKDVFFHETKGYILWKAGRIKESLAPYRRSVELSNGLPLLRLGLAQALLELDGQAYAREAVDNLVQVTHFEPQMPSAWEMLAGGYARLGETGALNYAMAERFILIGDRKAAVHHITKALELLPPDAPMYKRAMDIRYLLTAGNDSDETAKP